jgi:hypothetical protein
MPRVDGGVGVGEMKGVVVNWEESRVGVCTKNSGLLSADPFGVEEIEPAGNRPGLPWLGGTDALGLARTVLSTLSGWPTRPSSASPCKPTSSKIINFLPDVSVTTKSLMRRRQNCTSRDDNSCRFLARKAA